MTEQANALIEALVLMHARRLADGVGEIPALEAMRDFLISKGFEPRKAANTARAVNILVADAIGCPVDDDFRAGVAAELED